MPKPVRIIIADANDHMLNSLTAIIGGDASAKLVAAASDGRELISILKTEQPDIVITDLALPFTNGIEVILIILTNYPLTGIIIFSGHAQQHLLLKASGAGATGFVSKDAPCAEIMNAVKAVHRNKEYRCSISAGHIEEAKKKEHTQNRKHMQVNLSDKEVMVLRYSEDGLSNKEIAIEMGEKKRTIDAWKIRIGQKTNTKKTTEMIAYARENNLI